MTTIQNTSLSGQLPQLTETIHSFESLTQDLSNELSSGEPELAFTTAGFADGPPDMSVLVQSSALEATRRSPLQKFLARFSDSEEEARTSIKDVYKYYKEARATLEEFRDIVQLIVGAGQPLPPHDIRVLILDYLTKGKCTTRLGDEIVMPTDEGSDRSLYTLLGIIRIVNEGVYNQKFTDDLPWLADDNSSAGQRFKKYEMQASKLGDHIGSTLGRAASVSAVSLINPVLKLPDEATVAISFIAGIQARKVAEIQMHRYLVAHPGVN